MACAILRLRVCVESALLRGEELKHYVLRAWVVMPNHVHVLLDPLVPPPRITLGIKRASAKEGNAMLGKDWETLLARRIVRPLGA